jgi:hypothetical protein
MNCPEIKDAKDEKICTAKKESPAEVAFEF